MQLAESYKIMKTKTLAISENAKPDREVARGLNLAAVKCMIIMWLNRSCNMGYMR